MSAAEWLEAGKLELGMLPLDMDDALLPGETMQFHLYEAPKLALYERAAAEHSGCFGLLLVSPAGNAAAVAPLVEVVEMRRREVGVWLSVRCVGRVQLEQVDATKYHYITATVAPLVDEGVDHAAAERLTAEIHELHSVCRELSHKLTPRELSDELDTQLDDAVDASTAPDYRVEYGHEKQPVLSFVRPLDAMLAARRDELCAVSLDLAPSDDLAHLYDLWGAADEREAQVQLLGFTAHAGSSAWARYELLGCESAVERLQLAVDSLRKQQKRFAAWLAVSRVTKDKSV